MGKTEIPQPHRTVRMAGLGLGIVCAYALAGVLQVLVWNPLAAVPGSTLGQIRADMARANESLTADWVIGWGAIGVALAAAVFLTAAARRTNRIDLVVAAYLVLLVFAAPSHMFVAFAPGMSLADTFMISGGDHAPWGVVLYLVSTAAMVTLIVLIVRSARAASANLAAAYERTDGEFGPTA
ncbi:hypothetical protein [Cryobacterium roopkundense]|uniref:Uncharacterized protein n=1 Tax=Cryobacterium roopkundense TaxID=1001240 RepID=A0A7W8ZTE9_9MICO|nr:hypothetical protein [Cryobacterium roopkundense]MBB5639858.1 hypothetical protein [Cryobacterium roopkundense]